MKQIVKILSIASLGIAFYLFLSDSRYYIVQDGQGLFHVEHRGMFNLHIFTATVGWETLEQARDSRDNIWNPTNTVLKRIE